MEKSLKKKVVPFVANHEDDIHCVNAVFRMVHQYFFGKDLSWEEIDRLTKAIPGKGTWTFVGEMEFAKKGLQITNIETTDYGKLQEQGVEHLKTIVGEESFKYYLERTNIASVLKFIPEYLKWVKHETREAEIKEIVKFLKEGCLVGAEINSRILNKKEGFSLHYVLLYDFDGKNIILHDPGFPPIEARKVSLEEFERCFCFPGASRSITVFRKKVVKS